MSNYDFLDAHSSILSAESSLVAASTHRQVIEIAKLPSASVSGTVGASIIGLAPVSVDELQGTSGS